MKDIYTEIVENRRTNKEFALCIITDKRGSVPRAIGAKMLVYSTGSITGTIGGGKIEKKVIEDAMRSLKTKEPLSIHYDLSRQLQMSCGGSMEVYIEPVMRKNKLYIFGAGHTGRALARRALDFEFEVTIIDDRRDYIEDLDIEGVCKIHSDYQQALQVLPFDDATYITIMTYSHPHDREILTGCLPRPHAYLGMMGSRRKVELTKKMFTDDGVATEQELATVDMPMGIEINADGPDEIAISILAKLISVKNKTKVK